MGTADAAQTYREVMTREPPPTARRRSRPRRGTSCSARSGARPGLSRRDRRWVTLACVAAADAPEPIDDHVYAALNSGDIELEEMLEFVLQFAVYCGWPKASHVEGVIRRQWARIQQERGEEPTAWPLLDDDTLGPNDWAQRLERGAQEFADVNLVPAPRSPTRRTPRPASSTSSSVTSGNGRASPAVSAASSPSPASPSTTRPRRCGRTSPRRSTRATSPRRRWTRSSSSSRRTTASPRAER